MGMWSSSLCESTILNENVRQEEQGAEVQSQFNLRDLSQNRHVINKELEETPKNNQGCDGVTYLLFMCLQFPKFKDEQVLTCVTN